MKPARESKPAAEPKSSEPSASNPLAESLQRTIEQQMKMRELLEEHSLEQLKLAQTTLDTLRTQFDALLDRMQTAAARTGMDRAFHATAEQLGKAAVDAARKRG